MKRNRLNFLLVIVLLVSCTFTIVAQEVEQRKMNKSFDIMPFISYGMDFPLADMKKRFGDNLSFNGGTDIVFKNKFSIGFEFNYKFGKNVKEDVLSNLRLENGGILSTSGFYGEILIRERALYLGARIGKTFSLPWYKKYFELKLDLGAGYFSHYISIFDSEEAVPELRGDLLKGYERSTNGIALKESIALHYVSKQNWRLYLSIESLQGFTKPVQGLQYNTGLIDYSKRFDMLTGFQVGFILPFNVGSYAEEIYY